MAKNKKRKHHKKGARDSASGTLEGNSLEQRSSEVAHRMLLDDAPAAVLVNQAYEMLHSHGPMVNYLESSSGQPSADLLSALLPSLRNHVCSACISAAESGDTVVDEDARVERDGQYATCRITVKTVRMPKSLEGHFLISFEDRVGVAKVRAADVKLSKPAPPTESIVVQHLEVALKATREDLRATIEELASANEDLKLSNAELHLANTELHGKVLDLEEAHNDNTNLLSSTDISTLFLDADMRIKRFAPPNGALLSLIEADVGRPISDLSSKVANDNLAADAQRVLDSLAPSEKELWLEEPEARCYLRRIVPYKTGEHRIEGVFITFVDITSAKRDEATLVAKVSDQTREVRAGKTRMKLIVEAVVDAIVTIDAYGIVDLFNPAAEQMFGYRAGEVIGRNVKMLMPAKYADEHDGYLRAFLQTGEAKIIGIGREVRGKRKDGTTFPLDLGIAELPGGGALGFVGTMRDLTDIRQAQLELAQEHALSEGVISTARAIILRLDRKGRVLSFNPYMENLCGYKLEEVKGKDWIKTFVPRREQGRIKSAFAEAIVGTKAWGNISPILTKDRVEVLVEWYSDVLNVRGQPLSLIAVGHDVTAREKLEREFLQAQKMEAVGRLAGGVAHDFNNLLAGILGGIRIASKGLATEHAAKKMLDQVQEEVERGASITRRLLDFSRVRKPKPGLLDPRATLYASERMIRRLIGEDVDVQVACDSSNSQIYGDAGQVEQAVLNLAINARDAMPRGGKLEIRCGDIDLSARDVERLASQLQPGAHLVLSVRDTGCGMDAETKSKALEAFFTTKAPGLGTGLGLSSVVTMMELFDGHLELETELDVGTTVRLFFPRASVAPVVPAAAPVVKSPPMAATGETILLVEDEMLVRLGVQHVLEERGYVVLAAKDPAVALKLLESTMGGIDLLLTDVLLPGMSGPELAVAINTRRPGTRVLYMSAFPTEELVAQKRIPPGTHTLEKPFADEQLAATVREAIESAPLTSDQ